MRGYDQVWIRRIEFSPGRVTTLSDACVLFKNAKSDIRRRQTKLTTHSSKNLFLCVIWRRMMEGRLR